MPDPLEVRLGSRASGEFGSFGKCGPVWSFPKPPDPVPHSERLYLESSRSADRCDAQLPRWFCCGRVAGRDDGRRSRRCFLCCFLPPPSPAHGCSGKNLSWLLERKLSMSKFRPMKANKLNRPRTARRSIRPIWGKAAVRFPLLRFAGSGHSI
jgi:hypothetical protein